VHLEGVLPKSISASDVGQTFLSAGSGDFPVPGFRVKLSALVREVGKLRNRQARKPALQFGQHALDTVPGRKVWAGSAGRLESRPNPRTGMSALREVLSKPRVDSSSPREERVGRGLRRGEFPIKTRRLSPALSSTSRRRGSLFHPNQRPLVSARRKPRRILACAQEMPLPADQPVSAPGVRPWRR